MQMIPVMITKEYQALILIMLHQDSTGFQLVGSQQNQHLQIFHVSSCSWTKFKPIQEKQKKYQMKPDLRAKVENPNILVYVQPHAQASCLSDIGRWHLSLHPILERQNVLGTRLLYICTYDICIHANNTHRYDLCDRFMLALQYDL